MNLIEKYKRLMSSKITDDPNSQEDRVTVTEALTSTDASILIPRVVSDVMREAAEPLYIGSKFLQTIRMDGPGRTMIIPTLGALRAHEIPETGEYPEETLDLGLMRGPLEVRVKNYGLMVPISEEAIADSQWDILGYHIRAAGRAMARKKEEVIFNEFSKHGHIVFDNSLRAQYPEAGTTGLNKVGELNDTMSVEDMIDLVIAVMANGYVPTDILMHPLTWTMFAKNELIGSLTQGALGGYGVNYNSQDNPAPSIRLNPDNFAGRLPFPIQITFSPFIPFDKVNKRFDMYVVDRNEIGVLIVKEDMSTDQFDNPLRDIRNLKVKERYGVGILNEGKAIAVARNINFAKSYPEPVMVRTIS